MNTVALPAEPTATDAAGSLFSRGRASACIGAIALISLLAFEAMAVAAAMPAIASALQGTGLYALAFGGLIATSLLGMVLAGLWCDRQGALRSTLVGLAVFAAGLLIAGFADGAHGMAWLVLGRIVQGLGAGMLGVALYVGMGQVVPPALHAKLFAMFAAAWVLPALVGPTVAAWLVDQLGWRSVFLVVAAAVPLAAALLLPSLRRLPPPVRDNKIAATSPALLGWAALGAAGALLLHAAGRADSAWGVLGTLALGLAVAGSAALRLLPRGSLVAARGLPAVIALRGLLAAAFGTAEVFVPLYLTHEVGWSLARAGLALSLGGVCWSIGSAVQARIQAPAGRQTALQLGFAAVSLGLAIVGLQLLLAHAAWLVVVGWALAGFGIGLSFPMLSVLTLAHSVPAEQGRNASALQLSDALCSSAALAVAGALFNQAGSQGTLGHGLVLAVALALVLAGAVLARRAFG